MSVAFLSNLMSLVLGSACMCFFVGVAMISARCGGAALRTELLKDSLFVGGDVNYEFIPRGRAIVCCLGKEFLCF